MAANRPDSSLTNILQTNLGTWLPQYCYCSTHPATTHGQRPYFNTLANTKILVRSKVKTVHSVNFFLEASRLNLEF